MAYITVDIFAKACTASLQLSTRVIEVKCGNTSICLTNEEAAELVRQIAVAMEMQLLLSQEQMADGNQTSERC